jgi:hypothetical protein
MVRDVALDPMGYKNISGAGADVENRMVCIELQTSDWEHRIWHCASDTDA